MSQVLDLLRNPALVVVFLIFLIAGAILSTAIAALLAQMGLLLRMKTRIHSRAGMATQWRTAGSKLHLAELGLPLLQQPLEQKGTGDSQVIDADWRKID
jgi:hypothetical protein